MTFTEPINFIVGSSGDDASTYGTYRPDIVLGLAGKDVLDDGDKPVTPMKAWANHQLFGGLGDDTFKAGYGSDLLHGGDKPMVGAATSDAVTAQDGKDTADYTGFSDGSPGITITVGGAAVDNTFAANPDFVRAVFVKDNGHDNAINTLISVEKIIATTYDDTLKIYGTTSSVVANASTHVGGLYSVDLAGRSINGNLVDLSEAVGGARFDMASGRLEVGSAGNPMEVLNAGNVTGSAGNDVISGNEGANIIDGGAGDDTLFGIPLPPSATSLPSDQLIGGPGNDTLVASTFCQLTGGVGTDTFWIPKRDEGPSQILITDPETGDALIWNGYTVSGGSAIHLDADRYTLDGQSRFRCAMGYLDSHGVIYYYTTTDAANLTIYTPDGQRLKISDWSPGEMGINLTGGSFDQGQYQGSADPFPSIGFSDVCFDGIYINEQDIGLRGTFESTTGPLDMPLMPFV